MNALTAAYVKPGSKFGEVPLAELKVDPKAQRLLTPGWVKARVKDFAPDKVGYITVNRRVCGTLYIVDGQHRVALLKAVKFGPKVHAEMFDGLTQQEEARLFRARNDRRAIRKIDDFNIAVTAGDPQACDISAVAAELGLRIGKNQLDRCISSVDKLERIYEGGGIASPAEGRAALRRTLAVLMDAWGTSPTSFAGPLVHGLGLVQLRYHARLDQNALVAKLAPCKGGATGMLGSARALSEIQGRPIHDCMASLMVDAYNKGRRTLALDPWEMKPKNRLVK
jgi:hypothetical protein